MLSPARWIRPDGEVLIQQVGTRIPRWVTDADKVKAVIPFYGFPQGDMQPDWSKLTAAVSGHMAEHDDFFPAAARALEAKLRGMGKNVTLHVHADAGHAFMGPHNALGTLNTALAAQIWPQVVSFL